MKISLDCSSQLELVEVVRTEESLGSVQGVFRMFFFVPFAISENFDTEIQRYHPKYTKPRYFIWDADQQLQLEPVRTGQSFSSYEVFG